MAASPTSTNGHSFPRRLRPTEDGDDRIRLLMLTHELVPEDKRVQPIPGYRDAFTNMHKRGEIASFNTLVPAFLSSRYGHAGSLNELLKAAEALRPNVVLVTRPTVFRHEAKWIKAFLESAGNPVVLYWEGDPWGGWSKPPDACMRAWLAASDVVFSVASGKQSALLSRIGARDIRPIPHTYCHVTFAEAEAISAHSDIDASPRYDAVLIGSRLAHFGGVGRLPGSFGRARLVRVLQRHHDLRLAIYGTRWRGRGVQGVLPFTRQIEAIREGLLSVNWDHYPKHESYFSDRLPISLLAGRVHITTHHEGLEWLPGSEAGLFLEPTIDAVVNRAQEILSMPRSEVLALGFAAHEWVKGRLSAREAARYMLGAVDERLLADLPADPWNRLAVQE